MRLVVLILVSIFALGASACGSKKKQDAVKAAPDAAVAKAPPADAAAKRPGDDLPKAKPPEPATADDCKVTGAWSANLMTIIAMDRGVAEDQAKEVGKVLGADFTKMCNTDKWPPGFLDCVGKGKVEIFTWQRCQNRLPGAMKAAWMARADEVIGKAGGTVTATSEDAPAEGSVAFEELCPDFWAELVRFDDCASSGMYVPDIENVLIFARGAEIGGLIPPDRQARVKQVCDDNTAMVRDVEASVCGKVE